MEFFILNKASNWLAVEVSRDLAQELAQDIRTKARRFIDAEAIEFEAGYKLDDDEVFSIQDFVLPPQMVGVFENGAAARRMRLNDLRQLGAKAFAGVQLNARGRIELIGFFSLDRAKVLDHSVLHVSFSNNVLTRVTSPSLVIPEHLAAVFRQGALYFETYSMINRVIDMSHYFQEATEEEVREFVEDENLVCDDVDRVMSHMDKWSRTRIALIERANILGDIDLGTIQRYGREHGVNIQLRRVRGRRRIVLPTNKKQMKDVIRLLCDDFLDSGLTEKRYLTNSKVQIRA